MRFLCGNLDLKIIIFDYKQRLLVARLRYFILKKPPEFYQMTLDDATKYSFIHYSRGNAFLNHGENLA